MKDNLWSSASAFFQHVDGSTFQVSGEPWSSRKEDESCRGEPDVPIQHFVARAHPECHQYLGVWTQRNEHSYDDKIVCVVELIELETLSRWLFYNHWSRWLRFVSFDEVIRIMGQSTWLQYYSRRISLETYPPKSLLLTEISLDQDMVK